ncbi:hypothetical protein TCAL_01655 [Tigriopus californicus]|uniref:Calcium-transporting ATPase n=1 Tax=Tigriopus californicus TaxID=6832 RepID=A0A553PC92_TIGCA|nr:calcium-transporting ATPase type 2C member 1-like [Tigriopus californicus]TRY75311.1 hypothetical protein TCAL_01655 [Tigriopus californicus]|eukprot:TCALIF_01655-PA protein Name:"Similar to ATP2C1 Calcium-transporting ATPase type 2C member 1 (Bos taurus)" AED:0.03 eAED:0.03 QI:0/-1/0/1/-1/1/1/0/937
MAETSPSIVPKASGVIPSPDKRPLPSPVRIHARSRQTSTSGCTMDWLSCEQAATLNVGEVQSMLEVSTENGLTTAQADHKRGLHGLNQVGVQAPDPLWKKYLDQFNNPFILLLLSSALISVCMQQFDDAISITVAIVIVVTVGFVQEYRSEKTLERMGSLLPPTCQCLRDGQIDTILAKYLVPGDVVALEMGDRIPADLRLLEVNELTVDESSFTGETEPKYKTVELTERQAKLACNDMSNICFQGTLVIQGKGLGVVICTGERSQFGEVFKMMQAEDPPRTPLQKSMDVLGKQLTIYSIGVIGLIMLVGWLQGRPILDMFNIGVSLAVAAIPEGLPIVVTVTLAFGVMRMARRNAVVKRLPTVEALGCVDWICSDKTGTLTSNEMTVTDVVSPERIMLDDISNQLQGGVSSPLERANDVLRVLEVGIVCNNAVDNHHEGLHGSPTEKALLVAARNLDALDLRKSFRRLHEIPFSSERKYMAVECENASSQIIYMIKGAPEVIIEKCTLFPSGQGSTSPMTPMQKQRATNANIAMAKRGKRVLALARGANMDQLEFAGLIALQDPPRAGVAESIQILKRSQVQVCMITGDGRETAAAIAHQLGLSGDNKTLLSGHELDNLSEAGLESAVEKCFCFYRTTPRHKVRIVKALQANGRIVGMTGDGVNDGVAIKKADVGIAMGVNGTDVCKEAADMILLNDDFSTILNAIEEGKCIFYNIRNFVRFQLSTSISALMLISLSTLLDIPNPLNPMQILWINVIMDGPPAQSLGLEPADHEVLKRPPRKQREEILSRTLLINVLISASVIISGTLWVYKETMEDGKMTARETTMTFTCFVFFDMFNALSSRSQERLIYEIGFFSNRVFVLAVSLSILGQFAVIYLPPLQYVFQTEALAFSDLVLLTLLSSSVFIVSETKKLWDRGHLRKTAKENGKRNEAHSV